MSKSISGKLILPYKEYFDLPVIFDCGQAFRFYPIERNGIMGFEGVAGNIARKFLELLAVPFLRDAGRNSAHLVHRRKQNVFFYNAFYWKSNII